MSKKLPVYNPKELAKLMHQQLIEQITELHIVRFDDGDVEAVPEETIYSAACWNFYNDCPAMPTSVRHHIGSAELGMETHRELIGAVWIDALPYLPYNQDVANRKIYEATNSIYNNFICTTEICPTTLNILDFVDLLYHPEIKKANEEAKPTKAGIEQAYRRIEAVLRTDPTVWDNPIAQAVRNGLVSMGQVLQCIGPRGFVTEYDSNIFRNPIMQGSVHGFRKLEDSMKESRSTTKSLSFTDEPLQYTEFLNRRLQLMSSVLKNLHEGNCGTKLTMEFLIKSGSDLRDFSGQYIVQDNGQLMAIRPHMKELIGKTVKMRTVLYCEHPDPQGVCEICYGQMSYSIPKGTNIGHVAAISLGEKISQKVLSLKHEDRTSSAGAIELSEFDMMYVSQGSEINELKLHSHLENKKVKLLIDPKQAEHLADVERVKSVLDLPLEFVSNISRVYFEIETADGIEVVPVQVSMGSRLSSLTYPALEYIKNQGIKLNNVGQYIIDLKDWPIDEPMFRLPMRHVNMLDYAKSIDRFIKSSEQNDRTYTCLRDFKTVESALSAFHGLVSSELRVNAVHLMVIIKTCMVRSIANRDYRMPLPGNQVLFATYSALMARRSLANLLTFQDQKRVLNASSTFLIENRPDGVMDQLFRNYSKSST